MTMKIGTLNLCLGLKSKKEDVKELILGNQIDILCLQEVEVETGYDSALLEFRGYKFSNHFASMLYTITKCQNQLCIIRLKGVWLNLKNMGFCLYILRTLS